MHNYLLRYYVAEHGLDPDRDIQIRAVPPPEMVANLRADNIDGFLAPDPVNQRAVYDGVGFIHALSKEIWDGHPCCAFAASKEFVTTMPNTYHALLKSIIDATAYARKVREPQGDRRGHRAGELPEPAGDGGRAGADRHFRRRPRQRAQVPDRIDFDPFPWHSFAVWILTQMKRWGQIKGEVDYQKVAREVFLATDATRLMAEAGLDAAQVDLQELQRNGPRLRPDEAEGVRRRLRDQASMKQTLDGGIALCAAACGGRSARGISLRCRRSRLRPPIPSTRSSSAHRPPSAPSRRFRHPADLGRKLAEHVRDPFYDRGPNDKGIGVQLAYSISRVLLGFSLAALVAVPAGFLIGMSPLVYRALDPSSRC